MRRRLHGCEQQVLVGDPDRGAEEGMGEQYCAGGAAGVAVTIGGSSGCGRVRVFGGTDANGICCVVSRAGF